ncbi:MAG TPA: LytTR family DNA-binding domain-containing protein [Pyrinomonadaceae bacterium]|jgi:two-component system LytT family response regulator
MADAVRLRAIVVDDEMLARQIIGEMLEHDDEVEIVAECVNGREAIEAIQTHQPDLLFLDIQMPEVAGFEVLEALKGERSPIVIFVTAYDQYAVRAFDYHALDYLLKPFDRERFEMAVSRAKTQLRRERNGELDKRIVALLEALKAEARYVERLVIKNGGRVFFLEANEVNWIEAEGNYVRLHTDKKAHLLRETISSLEEQLDPKKFLRVHRSTIVRIDSIRELQPWFHGEYHIILHNGTKLTLSRNYREQLQGVLGKNL